MEKKKLDIKGNQLKYCKEDIMCVDLKTMAYIIKGMYQQDIENGFVNKEGLI